MAEYIDKELLRQAAKKYGITLPSIMMNAVPTADVCPVVRCKDCKHVINEDDYELWCNGWGWPMNLVTQDDYCSHGADMRAIRECDDK